MPPFPSVCAAPRRAGTSHSTITLMAPEHEHNDRSQNGAKDPKSLSRSLGEFFGQIWKGVKEPVGKEPSKQIVRQETTEEVRETDHGKVIVRRTVIEELEIPTPPPQT